MCYASRPWRELLKPILDELKDKPESFDETYIRVKVPWYNLYRAVDKTGQTINFLLTAHRDKRGQAFPCPGHSGTWCAREGDD